MRLSSQVLCNALACGAHVKKRMCYQWSDVSDHVDVQLPVQAVVSQLNLGQRYKTLYSLN
jgi:hypothetical protein